MQQVQIDIDVAGEHYNHWPYMRISINNDVFFDGPVEGSRIISFTADCSESNDLCLEHYGKHFGKDGIWDSAPDGSGSCSLLIKDIRLNTVSIGESLMSKLEFVSEWDPEDIVDETFKQEYSRFNSNGSMSFNGSINMQFETPVYDWLIISKYKVPITDTATFSNYSLRWHYDADIELLDEIKGLLKHE